MNEIWRQLTLNWRRLIQSLFRFRVTKLRTSTSTGTGKPVSNAKGLGIREFRSHSPRTHACYIRALRLLMWGRRTPITRVHHRHG